MTQLMRVRASINYGAGGPGLSTHYWRPTTAGGNATEALAAVTGVRAFWAAFAGILLTTTSVLVQGAVDMINDTDGSLAGGWSATPPAAVVGSAGGSQLPVFTSLIVDYTTAGIVHGRRVRGRTFVGPLAVSAATGGGAPTVADGTAATAAIAALLAVADPVFVVWSRPNARLGRVGSNATVTGGQAQGFFGSLRSRRD